MSLFDTILIVLIIAVAASLAFRYIHLPVILGYLLVGVIVGPYTLGWISDISNIRQLAEFGVVFLMFTVGLEFSLSKLIALRSAVFLLGGLQVILTISITAVIGIEFGMRPLAAIVCGGIFAMSSTAIVIKLLTDRLEINARHATNAIGILLFQDLAVIPLLIIIASFSATDVKPLSDTLALALLKGIIATTAILGIGRWFLRPLLRIIAGTRVIELFTLTVLLVTLGSAWITHKLELSTALGAFLAGMMLGESEFRHQLEVEIRPFRDVLLGLFFISIGMLLNISTWGQTWMWILLLFSMIVVIKAVLIIGLSRLFGNDAVTSFRTGIILAQGGEFGLAILYVALANKILPNTYGQVILGAILLSIALAPLLIHYNDKIVASLFPKKSKSSEGEIKKEIAKSARTLSDHVIICGYGRVGQNIARFLETLDHEYIAIDIDPERVQNAVVAGFSTSFGDATHLEILKAAKLAKAKAMVISFDNLPATIKILDQVHAVNKKIPVLVRCKDESELIELQKHGAAEIITETFEESVRLAYHLLLTLEVPSSKAAELIKTVRKERYDVLSMVIPGTLPEEISESSEIFEELRPIIISKWAYAAGRRLDELSLEETGCKVIAIRPRGKKQQRPNFRTKIKGGDIVVLYGPISNLDMAEHLLLKGNY